MRPKKIVLLIDSNETTQSTMRFLLETKGYRVLSATTGAEALDFATKESISVMLLRDQGRSEAFSALARDLKDCEDAPLIFISRHKENRSDDPCFDIFHWEHALPVELIERVKVCAARKRGPKPAPERKPVQPMYSDPFMDYIRGCA